MPPRKLKNHLQAEVSIIGHSPVESVVNRLLLLTCFFFSALCQAIQIEQDLPDQVIEQLWATNSTIECLWVQQA